MAVGHAVEPMAGNPADLAVGYPPVLLPLPLGQNRQQTPTTGAGNIRVHPLDQLAESVPGHRTLMIRVVIGGTVFA